jgi:sulfate transport system substrate-binding protein
MNIKMLIAGLLYLGLTFGIAAHAAELLNVSYDPTREFYEAYNKIFADHWKQQSGATVTINQSHGGSGKQARAVIDGLEADVVTLALAYDIDAIAERAGLLPKDWQTRLPSNSCPYTSTIVFLVRKGNPKGIHDWGDLTKPGLSVITPNPKTSGGARWIYLAAWAYAREKSGEQEGDRQEGEQREGERPREPGGKGREGERPREPGGKGREGERPREPQPQAFLKALFKNVPVLDSGARGATTTFVQRGIGDVLLTWENEALLAENKLSADKIQIVMPSISILAEPPVAVVDKIAEKHGAKDAARAYLEYLYADAGQELAAKFFYRPSNAAIAAKYMDRFPKLKMVTIDGAFGGWANAQKAHFADGGTFDQIYQPEK